MREMQEGDLEMNMEIVGMGTLGSELAYSLMLLGFKGTLTLTEPFAPNRRRAYAEFCDLLPIAAHTNVRLIQSHKITKNADAYVITAGARRTNQDMSKHDLFDVNYRIVQELIAQIPMDRRIFVATNPPIELCERLALCAMSGFLIPLRRCTDELREQAGDADLLNAIVLDGKGYTQFTPAYAIALRLLDEI